MFLESLAGGWLPRNPLVSGHRLLDSDATGSPMPVERGLRFGGVSGFAWSTLSLLVAAGAVYVVGRTSLWYDAIDVGLLLAACLFFVMWIPAFRPEHGNRVRIAVAFGVAGALTRFSMYVSVRGSNAFGLGDAFLGLARAGLFSALALWSVVFVGLAIVTGSRILQGRFLRGSSLTAGASVMAAGLLGFGIGLAGWGWPSANLASISLTSGATVVAVLWAAFVSIAFLQPRTAVGRSFLLGAVALQAVAAVLIFARVLWLPGGSQA